jgi:hypothetical protein
VLLRVLSAIFVVLALMLGEQLAFLIRLPQLAILVHDKHAVWLVFSTWPTHYNGFYNLVIIFAWDRARNFAESDPRTSDVLHRLRNISALKLLTCGGIALLLIPVFGVFSVISFRTALTIFCLFLCHVMFFRAERQNIPRVLVLVTAFLFWGFVSGLLLTDHDKRVFACQSETLQLTSGDVLPCSSLTLLEAKSLWLVEGPTPPRLLENSDFVSDGIGNRKKQ